MPFRYASKILMYGILYPSVTMLTGFEHSIFILYVSSMPTQHNVWSVEYTKPLTGCIKLSSMKVVATLWQLVAQKEGGWTQRGRPSTVAHRLRIYKLLISKQAREHGDGM